MYACLSVLYHVCAGGCTDQKRTLDPPELEFKGDCDLWVWLSGAKPIHHSQCFSHPTIVLK